jgi:hypothetical protein
MLKKYRKTVFRPGVFALISLLSLVIIIFSCERLEIKRITKVSTGSVSGITASSSNIQGTVIEQGEGGIKQHGHCWSETSNPTISIHKTDLGARNTAGTFNSTLVELSPNTQYFVRAYATDNDGTIYGNEVSFVTLDITIPAAPTNLIAQAISSSQINLSWTDNSNNEEGFKIERSPNGSTGWVEIAVVGAGVTNFQNTNLNPSTPYYYRVRAYNPGGNSFFSNTANATTLVDVPIPAAPTDLYADAISASEIYLSWSDNSNNEEGFKIERAGASMTWREIAVASIDTPYYLNTDLTASATYYYRVCAFNAGGNSGYSNTANATTLSGPTVPFAPTDLTAQTISDTEINLSWTDNSDNEEGFKIEYLLEGETSWNEIGTTEADITAGQIIGLSPGTSYYFRVRAYKATLNSDYSNVANAITSLCPSYLIIDHIAGDVAPITETNFRYGVVETDLLGENKCWIKQNLGAHHVAGGPTDDTEESAGWYWQFNRKQGYQHDGSILTPNTIWITYIDEASNWTAENDPCTILLGWGWRIPTEMEWANAYWWWGNFYDSYASVLKLHGAGGLSDLDGTLIARGFEGYYWSSGQYDGTYGWFLGLASEFSGMVYLSKGFGFSVRCIRD